MALEIVTFTGVDVYTDLTELASMAAKWPRVEFGVLVGTRTDAGIYSPLGVMRATVEAPEPSKWIDMEGRVRSVARFDLTKVRAVCNRIEALGGFEDVPLTMNEPIACPPGSPVPDAEPFVRGSPRQ